MVDKKAFRSLSYGLYIVGAAADRKRAGCVVNTFAQVTSAPAQVSVAINKENYTTGIIREAGCFTAVALDESVPMEMIGTFGFHSSADTDKFASWACAEDEAGMPYPTEHTAARFSARVVSELDLGTHVLFVGEVTEAEPTGTVPPMTYAYYHQVKGGKTPPKASSYEGPAETAAEPQPSAEEAAAAPKRVGWRCMLCGYIEWTDELPDDFVCPICGAGKDMFERIEE